jgi:hypothetical protein
MDWARILAYVPGMVDQELLARNEYLAAENRVLKAQLKGRLQLSNAERATLGEIGHRLGRKVLAEVANVARPHVDRARWVPSGCGGQTTGNKTVLCIAAKFSARSPSWVISLGGDRGRGPVYVRSASHRVEILCTAAKDAKCRYCCKTPKLPGATRIGSKSGLTQPEARLRRLRGPVGGFRHRGAYPPPRSTPRFSTAGVCN